MVSSLGWLNGWRYAVVLYGAPHCGYGWYATARTNESLSGLSGGLTLGGPDVHGHTTRSYGAGGLKLSWASKAAAVAAGVEALKAAGVETGSPVSVVSPSGRRMKETEVK